MEYRSHGFVCQDNFDHEMWGERSIFPDVKNVYYGLKCCILIEFDDLLISGRSVCWNITDSSRLFPQNQLSC